MTEPQRDPTTTDPAEPEEVGAGESIDDPPAVPSDPDSLVPEKAGDVTTITQLIRYAYAQAGKKLTVPAAVFSILSRGPEVDASHRALVLEEAVRDPLLAVPPRLLVAIAGVEVAQPLERQLVALVGMAMQAHPVFRDPDVRVALNGGALDRDLLFERVLRIAARLKPADLSMEGEELKASERHRLRLNVVNALALFLAINRHWKPAELAACLDQHLWREERRHIRGDTENSLLAGSRSPDVLGVVAEIFDRKVREAERQARTHASNAEDAHRRMHDALAELDAATEQLDRLNQELAARREDVVALSAALAEEREHRKHDRAHHVDDYEHLRARTVRMLTAQNELLVGALHAVRNDRPAVTEEFLERVLDDMKKALADLNEGEDH